MSTPSRSQGELGAHHSSSSNPAQTSAILVAPARTAQTTPGGLGAVQSIIQRAASGTSRASGQGCSQFLPQAGVSSSTAGHRTRRNHNSGSVDSAWLIRADPVRVFAEQPVWNDPVAVFNRSPATEPRMGMSAEV
ncbi:hypothetical protein JG687_00016711 [Phytophthora cactorum]|uniref:Uncharacterized protein n=1 Tax=Phytophthora cactorum TaxID=29920 RepID=A0A329SYH4_9STRA|nr:hypothetical protein Pcac1_g9435 [Phytophthora cactorum]KAG2878019.1 hypothetical protein PC114_g23337 [Phytophthora cactorum]KAG2900573.1 hypothetical protein PC115_g16155 [Phytophthora cactorum]KAG2913472.1 hypothetical protein PC117_g18581 [Phytophthora cactorum]KAG2981291.1 hypothetical protein PC118_g10710 [Phytophthora cactorum]